MNRIAILLLLFIAVPLLQAQYHPGVTDDDFDRTADAIDAIFGKDKYEISDIINIDSAAGKKWISENSVEDPFGTLKHCYVFVSRGRFQGEEKPYPKGFIGVVKDGQIIWRCEPIINEEDVASAGFFDISDINRDGKVELTTSWLEGMHGDSKCIWIFSWDGQKGILLNDVDEEGKSVIRSYSDKLALVDLDGDGTREFQGVWYDDSDNETGVIYSWNGQLYGKWPTVPQPPSGVSVPRNRVEVSIKASVLKQINQYQYSYMVENKKTSLQKIENFFIPRFSDSIASIGTRREWRSDLFKTPFGIVWTNLFTEENYIMPGEVDMSFRFLTSALPTVITSYIQGNNGGNGLKEILTNSVQVRTLGPADPPNPFFPLDFLDTLMNFTTQSRSLGWITSQAVGDKYLGYFTTAKTQLQQNNAAGARASLQSVLRDVDVDSSSTLTSEAYALLRFNTEYLLSKLPRPPEVSIDDLIALKHQAFQKGWLGDDHFVKELDNGLDNAKKHLARGDSVNSAKELEKFLDKLKKEHDKSIEDRRKGRPRDKRFVAAEAYETLSSATQNILSRLPRKKK